MAGLIGGIFDLVSQGISAGYNSAQAKKQREWQENMYSRQLSDTRRMRDESWARQDQLLADERAYNSPENQIALAREAGLNPALINGGQMTSPLTSISGTGASPDAPSPGSYSYTPVQPTNIGSRAVGNYLQSQSVDVAKDNAETARINAETQRFSAQARSIRDLAEAGKLDKETANLYIDNIFKSQTLETRVNVVKAELDNLKIDNQLKNFDLTSMRPAVRDQIIADTKRIESELSLIPARLESLSSQSALNRQYVNESESRIMLQDYERLWYDAQVSYLKSLKSIADAKLPQEQFIAEHQMLQLVWGNINSSLNAVSNLIGGVSDIMSRGKTNAGSNRGKSKDVSKPDNPTPPTNSSRDIYNKTLEQHREYYNSTWRYRSEKEKETMMSNPYFRENIYPYIKNK